MDALAKLQCEYCREPLLEKARGRPQRFCSHACRQAHWKIAPTPENGLRYRTGRLKPKSAFQAIEVEDEFEPENLSLNSYPPLICEKVNEVTFKITNGELTNVTASHGQWSGYRTTKALAWIIRLEAEAWLARCGNQVCGPSWFSEAKANTFAMAKGAIGDYWIANSIKHLNGLSARLIDSQADSLQRGVRMNDKWDGVEWESGTGYFDREATIEWREPREDRVPPNPPPKKVRLTRRRLHSVRCQTLRWKTAAVMRFYIDTANRLNGNCWPSEETVTRKLGLRNTKVVSRANRWWRRYGYRVGNQVMPFLRLARRGRRRPNGTKESNAYHVGWLPLIALVAERHWNPKLRSEVLTILHASLMHKVVNE